MTDILSNQLYHGDNLELLREKIENQSIDLIYLDPPFASNRDYTGLSGNRNAESLFDKDTF